MGDHEHPATREAERIQKRPVSSCRDLEAGDEIRATAAGGLGYSGTVLVVFPAMELFWIMTDEGERRIIELSEFNVSYWLRDSANIREALRPNTRHRQDWELQA
ncbi:hypothetical protein AB0284_14750 [Pseudarthrobacter phenanthrenivorans]|uniref:hypothetical protein n=1 Tax=Pseudarthrobacter phenanthrenivorans TaxID=361575 RepID=UPI00344DBC85